jgi:hypothetical protein
MVGDVISRVRSGGLIGGGQDSGNVMFRGPRLTQTRKSAFCPDGRRLVQRDESVNQIGPRKSAWRLQCSRIRISGRFSGSDQGNRHLRGEPNSPAFSPEQWLEINGPEVRKTGSRLLKRASESSERRIKFLRLPREIVYHAASTR